MKGLKYDKDKNRLDLVQPEFIEAVGKVLTFGARKYKANSWQQVEQGIDRYYAATLRHLLAWRSGEIFDPESKLPHLFHIACNIMFLIYLTKHERCDIKDTNKEK